MTRFQGMNAVVTGAGSGIGCAIASRLAVEGANVVVNDISLENATNTADSIKKLGYAAIPAQGDVSQEEDIHRVFEVCESAFGSCDILVNNAGIVQQKPFIDIDVEDWDRMISIHLRGCFLGCKRAAPAMLEQKSGVIINVASQLGQIGGIELSHYSAAKAGIIGLTKSMARELSKSGIRVNAIAPGPISTDLVMGLSEEWRKTKAAELPLGQFGTPEDVAGTVAFLASNDAQIYVGQTLGPNSGDVML